MPINNKEIRGGVGKGAHTSGRIEEGKSGTNTSSSSINRLQQISHGNVNCRQVPSGRHAPPAFSPLGKMKETNGQRRGSLRTPGSRTIGVDTDILESRGRDKSWMLDAYNLAGAHVIGARTSKIVLKR